MPNLFLRIMLWKLKLGNNIQMTSEVFDVHAAASVAELQETDYVKYKFHWPDSIKKNENFFGFSGKGVIVCNRS